MSTTAAPASLSPRRTFAWIQLVGGTAVLASYAWGFLFRTESMGALWGGVPESLRPIYTANMLLAALGYFPFTLYVLRLRPDGTRAAGPRAHGLFHALYLLILIPSALWLPLTFAFLEQPGPALWATIRLVLAATGIGSLGLVAALLGLPDLPRRGRALALIGLVPFCVQTALLDALVWPVYFER